MVQRRFKKIPRCPATGKVSYRDQDSAERGLARIEGENAPIRVYACQYCRHWHLTSKERR